MKKINFKKVPCKMIDGKVKDFDMAELIGNGMYFSVTDIGKLRLAEKIYAGEDVELLEEDITLIQKIVENSDNMLAFAKLGALDYLTKIKESKNERLETGE